VQFEVLLGAIGEAPERMERSRIERDPALLARFANRRRDTRLAVVGEALGNVPVAVAG